MKEKKPLTHPSFDELLALTVDDLGDQRAHEVREHLLDCPACLAQTRELLQLPDEAPSPEMELSDAELAMDWQRLSATLDGEAEAGRGTVVEKRRKVLPFQSRDEGITPSDKPPRRSTIWLLAALFSGAVIGLAFGRWVLLRPEPTSVQAVAVTNLISSEFYRRGELEKPATANCPPLDGSFVWVIAPDLSANDQPESLRVEIRSSAGRIIARQALGISARGEVQISIPRSLLENGQYLVAVQKEEGGRLSKEIPVTVECQ